MQGDGRLSKAAVSCGFHRGVLKQRVGLYAEVYCCMVSKQADSPYRSDTAPDYPISDQQVLHHDQNAEREEWFPVPAVLLVPG